MFGLTTSRAALIAAILGLSACSTPPAVTRGPSETAQMAQSGHELVTRTAAMTQLARRFSQSAPSVIHFDFNSDFLDWRARRILDEQAEWIIRHPNVRFSVTGHTDRVGPNAYNDELGMRRAKAALNYLVAQGVEEFRLIAMVSEGEDHPVIDIDTPERANRRVETEVIGMIGDSRRRMRAGRWVISTSDGRNWPGPGGENDDPVQIGPGPQGGDDPQGPGAPPSGTPTGAPSDDTPSDTPPQNDPEDDKPKGYEKDGHADAGRGNGDDVNDPGGSEGKNRGGDEEEGTTGGKPS